MKSTCSRFAWIVLAAVALVLPGCNRKPSSGDGGPKELLNVSYDPTRELWKALNEAFIPSYEKETGSKLEIKQSHAGSSSQARSVIDGLAADVVTFALYSDTEAIAKAGLIKAGWQERLPNGALPYFSTIVFVVRKDNPKHIQDWPDLIGEGVEVITPDPKTSANGKLSFLSAWGSVTVRGGSEQDATEYVTKLYQHVPIRDSGARAATTTFAQKKIGDVHLTWENEAYLETREAKGELEIIYPPLSIRAEPRVAVVDQNVDRKGTRSCRRGVSEVPLHARGAGNHRPELLSPLQTRDSAQVLEVVPADRVVRGAEDRAGWLEADARFFGDGGVFDQISATAK